MQGIQSIELGGEVLQALAQAGAPVPLRDVAAKAQMPTSQTRRYLLSLTRIGLVEQNAETGYYALGPLAIRLGLSALANLSVEREAAAFVAELRHNTQETVVLAVWTDQGPTALRIEESGRPVTLNVRVGFAFPMINSATGLIFGAYMHPDAIRDRVRKGTSRFQQSG